MNKRKQCVGGCGQLGVWRVISKSYICYDCRAQRPHKMEWLGSALKKRQVSWDVWRQLRDDGQIASYGGPKQRFVYSHQLDDIVKNLDTTIV